LALRKDRNQLAANELRHVSPVPQPFCRFFPGKKGLKSLFLCPFLIGTFGKEAAVERLEAKQVGSWAKNGN
jgi:hypothetical protein